MYFFDSEFTNFKSKELISLGIISEDGKREFYKENLNYSKSECSDFVNEIVVPLLDSNAYGLSYNNIAKEIKDWINTLPERNVYFVADYNGDLDILQNLLAINVGKLEKNVSMLLLDKAFKQVAMERGMFNHEKESSSLECIVDEIEKIFKNNSKNQHHALYDAKVLRLGWIKGLNYLA
jgi:hypothetical protein